MPLPVLFITTAAIASGVFGAGKTIKAVGDHVKADEVNTSANQSVENAKNRLNLHRTAVSEAMKSLGEEKIHILSGNVTEFVNEFEKIKNVDFQSSVGLEELKKLHIDQKDFQELKELGNFAVEVAGGATAGVAGGALTAVGAYSATMTFGAASTGTAISSLSGVAAHNATMAFLGGGALSAGGAGMAGGAVVLSSLVAGPALMVMGLITGAKCQESLDKALANQAQAQEIVESLDAASEQCIAIRRRTYMFYSLLARLDTYFLPLVWKMEDIIKDEGTDYRSYSEESKKAIMQVATTAGSIKAVLDTPIMNDDGSLTDESASIVSKIHDIIYIS